MKNFDVITGENWLMINMRRKAYILQKINVIIGVLVLTIIFSWVFNDNTDGLKNKTLQFFVILAGSLLILAAVFYRIFSQKGFIISRKDAEYIISKKHRIKKDDLVGICLDIYVDGDGTGGTTIRIKTSFDSIVLFRGLNHKESIEISVLVLNFLGLSQSSVKETYW